MFTLTWPFAQPAMKDLISGHIAIRDGLGGMLEEKQEGEKYIHDENLE